MMHWSLSSAKVFSGLFRSRSASYLSPIGWMNVLNCICSAIDCGFLFAFLNLTFTNFKNSELCSWCMRFVIALLVVLAACAPVRPEVNGSVPPEVPVDIVESTKPAVAPSGFSVSDCVHTEKGWCYFVQTTKTCVANEDLCHSTRSQDTRDVNDCGKIKNQKTKDSCIKMLSR